MPKLLHEAPGRLLLAWMAEAEDAAMAAFRNYA